MPRLPVLLACGVALAALAALADPLSGQSAAEWSTRGGALLRQGESPVIGLENLRQWLHRDHLSQAVDAYRHALEVDPGYAPALVGLADAALAQRIRRELRTAQRALRTAAGTPGGNEPDVLLHRALVERELGETDSALAALQAYAAAGGDPGVGYFELARTQFLAGKAEDAGQSYYAGARYEPTPAALAAYRDDIALIATSAELAAFDAVTDPVERSAWLVGFWGRRDTAAGRAIGERLAEHNRRWFYATSHYRLISAHRHFDITERYRPEQREFDDRGLIYLRHGEPDRRAFLGRAEPNESWLYERTGGPLLLHFTAPGKVSDYKLVESLLDVFGYGTALALRTDPLRPPSREMVALAESRVSLAPLYLQLARADGFSGRARVLERERGVGRASIAVGTTTDSYPRR